MQIDFGYSDNQLEFGRTTDTPNITYIEVLDIDNKILKIAFTKHMITV